MFSNLHIVVTGGTGSVGSALVRRLMRGTAGIPACITVFSRDREKQHALVEALVYEWEAEPRAVDPRSVLRCVTGDIGDYNDVVTAIHDADVVFHTAAMKLVPAGEYFPSEAVRINVHGAENLVRAIRDHHMPVHTVIGVSSDKACLPMNVMGMTKAIQERIFTQACLDLPDTRFASVRFGNILASGGSAVSLFLDQASRGGPITVTSPSMTRFLVSMDDTVSYLIDAYRLARRGEVLAPRLRSARLLDIATVVMEPADIPITFTGIRPGEKEHDHLVAGDEAHRTVCREQFFVVRPALPELVDTDTAEEPGWEYRSVDEMMDRDELRTLLVDAGLLHADQESLSTLS